MKSGLTFIMLALLLTQICLAQYSGKGVNDYLAPGVISEAGYRLHSRPAISPNGDEIFFAVIPPQVLFTRLIDGKWTKPEAAPFSEKNIQAPFYSPDGNRVYFQVTREDGYGSLDIWYVEKENNGWSKPKNPGSPPNSEGSESQPSVTNNGDMYFTAPLNGSGWNQGIYCSRIIDGKYSQPELLNAPVNSPYIDAYPFISADGSFLLFSSSRPDNEEKDLKLFVSFRGKNGSWNEPLDLSKKLGLNSAVRFGYISPDNKYLYFLMDNIIYRVDSKILRDPQ